MSKRRVVEYLHLVSHRSRWICAANARIAERPVWIETGKARGRVRGPAPFHRPAVGQTLPVTSFVVSVTVLVPLLPSPFCWVTDRAQPLICS